MKHIDVQVVLQSFCI